MTEPLNHLIPLTIAICLFLGSSNGLNCYICDSAKQEEMNCLASRWDNLDDTEKEHFEKPCDLSETVCMLHLVSEYDTKRKCSRAPVSSNSIGCFHLQESKSEVCFCETSLCNSGNKLRIEICTGVVLFMYIILGNCWAQLIKCLTSLWCLLLVFVCKERRVKRWVVGGKGFPG